MAVFGGGTTAAAGSIKNWWNTSRIMDDGKLNNLDQWESAFERCSVGRIRTAIGTVLSFSAQSGATSCTIRDFTNVGAGIRVQDLPILPLNFVL
jgi:hypothetical protein